jgi:phenylpyruvate tautomerase PptA (4-oxalocrotonate tautomerase family)
MPLVQIEIVGGDASASAPLSRPIADALGNIFGSAAGQTWVRVRSLPREAYAENGVAEPLGENAVFVEITKRTLPPAAQLAAEAQLVSRAVAQICGRPPERIHVIYEPPGAGRIAFGGNLIP